MMLKKITSVSFTAILFASMVSACSVVPKPKPASTIYRLSVPDVLVVNDVKNTQVVNVEYPTIAKALDGVNIILSPDGQRLTAAAGAQWSEPVPELLRNALIDTLSNNIKITGIIPKGNTRVPYRLNMDIRRFEAVFDQGEEVAPLAIIQLSFSLTETRSRQLVGSYTVKVQKRADAARVSAIVNAQDVATKEAMENASDWLSSQFFNKKS
ncbi:MAG: hypothetical protein COA43_07075 [Robiginitomaculum sp.]|nr:MAG: hypothetical protein COA43_07075 [Robiginitomaculum sp.]